MTRRNQPNPPRPHPQPPQFQHNPDELLFEVEGTEADAHAAARVICGLMQGAAGPLAVPLLVKVSVGQRWAF